MSITRMCPRLLCRPFYGTQSARRQSSPALTRSASFPLPTVQSVNSTSLTFWKTDRQMMGAFLCIASNEVPPAVSRRVQLNINCEYPARPGRGSSGRDMRR